jgi:transposase
VDSLGQMMKFVLTPGQRHDITQASILLSDISGANILADTVYDSKNLLNQIKKQKCFAVILPKANRLNKRNYDKHIYKQRHLIECFFNKIKHFPRVFGICSLR